MRNYLYQILNFNAFHPRNLTLLFCTYFVFWMTIINFKLYNIWGDFCLSVGGK